MKQTTFIVSLLFSLLTQAQQKSTTAASSTTGRWFVGNTQIMSFNYSSRKTETTDNVANALLDNQKETGVTLSLPFRASLGSLQIGGSKTTTTAGNTNSKDNQNNAGIFLSPEVGKHFTDKISAGIVLRAGLNGGKQKSEQVIGNQTTTLENKINGWSLGLSPFLQYFFKGRDKKWSPYLILRPGISSDKNTQKITQTLNNVTTNTTYKYKENGWDVRSAIGMQKMLGKHFSFDVSFGYTYIYYKNNGTSSQNDDVTSVTKTHQPGFETGLRYTF